MTQAKFDELIFKTEVIQKTLFQSRHIGLSFTENKIENNKIDGI